MMNNIQVNKINRYERAKKRIITVLPIILLLITSILKYFLPSSITKILPLIAAFIGILIFIKKGEELLLQVSELILVLFNIWYFMGLFYTPDFSRNLGDVLSFIGVTLLYLVLSRSDIEFEKPIKIMGIGCLILSIIVIYSSINFDTIYELIISKLNYSANKIQEILQWTRNEWYAGPFPDRAPAAFFASMLIGVALYIYYKNKKGYRKIEALIAGCIGIYAILVTAKRGLFIGSLVSLILIYLLLRKANGKGNITTIIILSLIISLFYLIMINIPAAEVLIDRFINNDNMMTGRDEIYAGLIEGFIKSPIAGCGTGYANAVLGIGGHNIYMNVLCENGIIGVIFFIAILATQLIKTIKNLFKSVRNFGGEKCENFILSLYIQLFFIIYGMSGNPLYDNYILYFYFFALILNKCTRLNEKLKEENN